MAAVSAINHLNVPSQRVLHGGMPQLHERSRWIQGHPNLEELSCHMLSRLHHCFEGFLEIRPVSDDQSLADLRLLSL